MDNVTKAEKLVAQAEGLLGKKAGIVARVQLDLTIDGALTDDDVEDMIRDVLTAKHIDVDAFTIVETQEF